MIVEYRHAVMDIRDIEVRHLVALVAVADAGSFGRAADRLAFSQSAVSQQIAGLERVLGTAVFDRPGGPRPPQLTPAGRLLLEHARSVLATLAQAGRELTDLLDGVSGRLAIGSFQSVLVQLLPPIIGRALAETPGLDIRLHEGDQESLVSRLVADEIDLVFVVGHEVDQRLEQVHVLSDPIVAVVPLTWPEASLQAVPLAALRGRPLLGDSYEDPCHLHIDNGLRSGGVEPSYVFRANDNGALQAMVRAGMGAAIMPELAVTHDDPTVRIMPIDPPLQPREIYLAHRRDRTLSPATRRFMELTMECAAALRGGNPAWGRSIAMAAPRRPRAAVGGSARPGAPDAGAP